MESKKINQLATELAPDLSDLTIIGDPTTGISKKITLSQMASLFTGTVEEYANLAAFPLVGVADTIYIALDTNILYRWNTGTNAYVELSPNIVSSLVFNDANGFDGTINLVGSVATLTITTALTTGSVGFIGASGALLQDNANFFWDDTNNRLGLGTNAPTTALDVFGSGIIGRINGTSTNNAYLGFASAGTNKWSVGNVQSDHRFRIFSEANSAELITILQTGEFGIGIANPLTKLHIDGGATALIANLDANVSVAKSISFRSDNSNRINLEVSGTESGSNAGANFFIRRYSDAGSLIDTPLTITRSTGTITLAGALIAPSGEFNGDIIVNGWIRPNNIYAFTADAGTTYIQQPSGGNIILRKSDATAFLTIANSGAATFSNSVTIGGNFRVPTGSKIFFESGSGTANALYRDPANGNTVLSTAVDTVFVTSTGAERMRITSGGQVNVNSSQTTYPFYVQAALGNWTTVFENTANGASGILMRSTGGSQGFYYGAYDGGAYKFYISGTGVVNSTSTSITIISSDAKLKTDIRDYNKGLAEVLAMKPRIYKRKDNLEIDEVGFIAQEMDIALAGSMIESYKDEEGEPIHTYQLEWYPLLVKAIQEQQAQIEELKALINK